MVTGGESVLRVSIRPDVQVPSSCFTGVINRWPWPSNDTFSVLLLIVSISNVPHRVGQPTHPYPVRVS